MKLKLIKNLPANVSSGTDSFTGKLYQTFREELTTILLKLFPKNNNNNNNNKTFEGGTLPSSFYKAITLIPKPDKDITHPHPQKLQTSITDEHRSKNPQQSTSKQNPTTYKRIIHHDQVGFIPGMQGFCNIHKPISVIHHTNQQRNKNSMIISIGAGKAFDKIQHPFTIKKLFRK